MKLDLYWVGFRVTVNLTQYQSDIYLTTLALIFLLPVVGRCRKKRGKEERNTRIERGNKSVRTLAGVVVLRPQGFFGFLCKEDEVFPGYETQKGEDLRGFSV